MVRSHAARVPPLTQDWFWICAGVALYFGAWSAIGPLSLLLVSSAPALLARAYEVTAVVEICAMLAIARGMACRAAS